MTKGSCEKPIWSELSLGDLLFFLSLMETQNLTETAKREGMSLSTASRILRKLRDLLDDPLFLRSSPNLIPTRRAAELEPGVRSLVTGAHALEKPEVFRPAGLDRVFRIAVADNAVFAVLRGFVKDFFAAAPKAGIDFVQLNEKLFEKLASGEIDCAVYPSSRAVPQGVHTLRLFEVGYALCTRPDHPAAQAWRASGEIPWDLVRRCRKIQVSNRGATHYEIYSLDEKTVFGEAFLERAVTVPFFLAVPGLLAETDFVAVLPLQTARMMAEEGKVAVMPLHPQDDGRSRESFWTRLIWHERLERDPAMVWLRGLMKLSTGRVGGCVDQADS